MSNKLTCEPEPACAFGAAQSIRASLENPPAGGLICIPIQQKDRQAGRQKVTKRWWERRGQTGWSRGRGGVLLPRWTYKLQYLSRPVQQKRSRGSRVLSRGDCQSAAAGTATSSADTEPSPHGMSWAGSTGNGRWVYLQEQEVCYTWTVSLLSAWGCIVFALRMTAVEETPSYIMQKTQFQNNQTACMLILCHILSL